MDSDNTKLFLGIGAVALLGVGAYYMLKPEEAKAASPSSPQPLGARPVAALREGAKLGMNEGGGGSAMFPSFDLGSMLGGGAPTGATPGGGGIFDLGSMFGSRNTASSLTESQAAANARKLGFADGAAAMNKLLSDVKLKSPKTGAGYMSRYTPDSAASFAARLQAGQVDAAGAGGPMSYDPGFTDGALDAMLKANYRCTLFQQLGGNLMMYPSVMIAYHPNGAVVPPPPGYEALSAQFIDPDFKSDPNAVVNSPHLYTGANSSLGR